MISNSMIPVFSVYKINPIQYLGQSTSMSYGYLYPYQMINFPVNYYSGVSVEPSLFIKQESTPAEKFQQSGEINRDQLKNISEVTSSLNKSNNKDKVISSKTKGKNSQHSPASVVKRKKIQNKHKILKMSQNKNRNIVPSMVQQIFSYLSKPNKSLPIVTQVFSLIEHPSTVPVSVQRYYYFIKQIKEKLNHYLNTDSFSIFCHVQNYCLQMIPKEEQIFYLSVARRVTRHFIENHMPMLIIHSKRMFDQKRIEHLKVRRVLTEVLQGMRN